MSIHSCKAISQTSRRVAMLWLFRSTCCANNLLRWLISAAVSGQFGGTTSITDKVWGPFTIIPKKNISHGLWSCSPFSCILWVFQTWRHNSASALMWDRKRWCSSHKWLGRVGTRPLKTSRSRRKFFHFNPNPWLRLYQQRSHRILWTLL